MNSYLIRTCVFLFLTLVCCTNEVSKLEHALNFSGDNRVELETVLDYFKNQDDSLKLKAAIFLIENMPGHKTYESSEISNFCDSIYSYCKSTYLEKRAQEIIVYRNEKIQSSAKELEDIHLITADFLIKHIEQVFEMISICPWLKKTPLDDIFEYLLPYKSHTESLALWRDSIDMNNIFHDKDLIKDFQYTLEDQEENLANISLNANNTYNNQLLQIIHQTVNFCYDEAYINILKNRTYGIPTALETIFYANRSRQHGYANIIDPNRPRKPEVIKNRKYAKIYRETYSRNKTLESKKGEYVPDFFKNPFHIDVTHEYLKTADVKLNKLRTNKFKYAYLSVFNNFEWLPVCWTENKNNELVFRNMAKDIVYMPIFYHENLIGSLTYPFILHNNKDIEFLTPDTGSLQTIKLNRKYPFSKEGLERTKALLGMSVIASNDPEFKSYEEILVIDKLENPQYYSKKLNLNAPYKYWRVYNHDSVHRDVTEIFFYDKNNKQIKCNPIIPKELIFPLKSSAIEQGFDNDLLSNMTIFEYVELYIDEAVEVGEIMIFPLNDDNIIFPGHLYELLYFGENGWKSLGRKVATSFSIEFDNVPTKALYWIRNKSKGIEERIFTYDNGEVTFW